MIQIAITSTFPNIVIKFETKEIYWMKLVCSDFTWSKSSFGPCLLCIAVFYHAVFSLHVGSISSRCLGKEPALLS